MSSHWSFVIGHSPRLVGVILLFVAACARADEGIEFYEKKIRPVLVEQCYKCHGEGEKIKGGLRLDGREWMLKGGETGAAVVAGDVEKSLLIRAIRYKDPTLQMPPKERLADEVVLDFERWVGMGAPAPSGVGVKREAGGIDYAAGRKWWAFQPVPPPTGKGIDAFVDAGLKREGLKAAGPASGRELVRRATYDLHGLPPTDEEVEAFVNDPSPEAWAGVIERLLASPRYGERWGRHWLDVVRYTDSFDARGTGGPMDIPEIWRYRDWVIRAFNQDLPYDHFVRQQIAGDVLPAAPGFDETDGIVATGVMAMGNWGGGDADKEKLITDIVDDQVDVVGRAFMGLTLACARCHDHKFDPVGTEDYYGLAGMFFSSHILPDPGPKTNGPNMLKIPLVSKSETERRRRDQERLAEATKRLEELRDQAVTRVAGETKARTTQLVLAAWGKGSERPVDPGARYVVEAWERMLSGGEGRLFAKFVPNLGDGLQAWKGEADTPSVLANPTSGVIQRGTLTVPARSLTMHPSPTGGVAVQWRNPGAAVVRVSGKLADADGVCGNGIEWALTIRSREGVRALRKGEFANGGQSTIEPVEGLSLGDGDVLEVAIYPKKEYSCDTTAVELEVAEAGGARAWGIGKDLVGNIAAGNPNGPWSYWDLAGRSAGGEHPAVARLMRAATKEDAEAAAGELAKLIDGGEDELAKDYSSPKGRFFSMLRGNEALWPAELKEEGAKLRAEVETLSKSVSKPVATAHGIQEGGCPKSPHEGIRDVKVHIRGRYDRLGKVVPRRFPVVLAGAAQPTIANGSGRGELARWLTDEKHPLTARVVVNRIWQHHFGEGLVRTPNNFGKLGERPTHPELLDELAATFVKDGWSVKAMHRRIMLSSAYRRSSKADRDLASRDPDNRLFGRMSRRRLDAEQMRDAMLSASGKLDLSMGGPAVKDLSSGRRTVYLMTVRSDRSSYRDLFDAADPTAIIEKRIDSTVAPQALFLMNHPFVLARAKELAEVALKSAADDSARVDWLYRRLYGRPPTPDECEVGVAAARAGSWEAYCHVLLCANEFVYVD